MNSSISSSDPPTAGMVVRRWRALRVVGFVAFTALVVAAAGAVLDRISTLNPNIPKIREMLALEHETNAVIYIGDSTTLDGVNPVEVEAALGLRGYNMASGGQSLLEAEMVLRNYLEHNARPRLVVLGLFVNRSDGARNMNPEIYYGLPGDLRDVMWRKANEQGMTNANLSFRVFNWVKAYRYRSNISYVLDALHKRFFSHESRASALVRGHLALDYSKRQKPVTGAERSVAELNQAGLDSFLDFCAQQQLPVVMFEPPNTPGFSGVTLSRETILAAITQRVQNRKNVFFRSFNDAGSASYAADEWSGRNHLNRKGAIRFTREQLVPYLRDVGVALPTR